MLPTGRATAQATGSNGSSPTSLQTLNQNYTTFLTMLTTQLKNQDPLSPTDTNQFTQELVQFSGVEQQLQTNSQLGTLISLQQVAQATGALNFVGKTVTFNSATSQMTNSKASWSLSADKPATATVTITSATGQTVFSKNLSLTAGAQPFTWDGLGNDGTQWPDGAYNISVTALDANGKPVAVTSQASGIVSAVDITKTPPVLTVGNQTVTLDKITGVSSS
jgi:flagellar basal-body rod modification protein FlgD